MVVLKYGELGSVLDTDWLEPCSRMVKCSISPLTRSPETAEVRETVAR